MMAYFDDAYSVEDEDSDEGAKIKPDAIIASAAISDVLLSSNLKSLAVDLAAPGNTPIAANFTESSYYDDSIVVKMEQKRMYDSDVFITYVKIATPSQIRTAVAGGAIKSTRSNSTSKIAQNYNAIVAINGDAYVKAKTGYAVRQGEALRETTSNSIDLLFIDELGDFHIFLSGRESQEEQISAFKEEHEIINAFVFGPALVVDGKTCEISDDYQYNPTGLEPRAGIAQIDTLTYMMVVVNGRADNTEGVTSSQFADLMLELGAQQAYNLDGGNSATMVFNGEVYNIKKQAERSIYDIVYFASATE
ncbi:MAG: phosphodiester glycosidase family protein [Clostridiales bacterium]|nr:phosphodiester glycosidase family protein [Clostridiales bacterium]